MLELMKDLLNIQDNSKDNILNHYLDRAYNAIKNYLNYDKEEMDGKFEGEIVDLALFWYKQRNNTGIIQISQGSRSMTLERGIPKHIKESLPSPCIKVVG